MDKEEGSSLKNDADADDHMDDAEDSENSEENENAEQAEASPANPAPPVVPLTYRDMNPRLLQIEGGSQWLMFRRTALETLDDEDVGEGSHARIQESGGRHYL